MHDMSFVKQAYMSSLYYELAMFKDLVPLCRVCTVSVGATAS